MIQPAYEIKFKLVRYYMDEDEVVIVIHISNPIILNNGCYITEFELFVHDMISNRTMQYHPDVKEFCNDVYGNIDYIEAVLGPNPETNCKIKDIDSSILSDEVRSEIIKEITKLFIEKDI